MSAAMLQPQAGVVSSHQQQPELADSDRERIISPMSVDDTSQEVTRIFNPYCPLSGTDPSQHSPQSSHGRHLISNFIKTGHTSSSSQETPPYLTRRLTILFALAAGFTSANLAYSQPILPLLATDFAVSQSQIANVPAMAQAGNAVGLLMILPLADFFPRRAFTLLLMGATILLW